MWVGVAGADPIPGTGVFGSHPDVPEYGARTFSVDAGVDPVTGVSLAGTPTHDDYFDAGGMSLRNLALIGIGATDRVIPGA